MVPSGKLSTEIEYPSEDGKPMAESDFQKIFPMPLSHP